MSGKGTNIAIRLATALVVLPVALALIWIEPLGDGFLLFVAVVACAGLAEYYQLAKARNLEVEALPGVAAGTLVTLSAWGANGIHSSAAVCAAVILVGFVHVVKGNISFAGIAASIFGVVYVGWFAAHVVLLQRLPGQGPGIVTTLFVAVILTDTAAYFGGRALGRHKLAPVVSPNKTWEGAVSGFVFATLGLCGLYLLRDRYSWTALPEWPLYKYAMAGALLSVASQVGDLVESSLKRDAGVKDSGVFFPGHGGVLDRCDGFLFAAPVLYYIAVV